MNKNKTNIAIQYTMCFIVFCVLWREEGKKTDFIPMGPYTIKYVAPGEKKEKEEKKSGNNDGRHTNFNWMNVECYYNELFFFHTCLIITTGYNVWLLSLYVLYRRHKKSLMHLHYDKRSNIRKLKNTNDNRHITYSIKLILRLIY